MSLRPTKVVAPQSCSRLDEVLRAGHNISMHSSRGKYILWGNEKADWGIAYFDDYDTYMEVWHEWRQQGWLETA
eukprot:708374-Prymnesium_polylepis.1